MTTASSTYLGSLRVESIHHKSEMKVITDAPIDNHGKGEAFSPTDLTCTSLASCMLTIIGIWAEEENLPLNGTQVAVTKHMLDHPRRIGAIDLLMTLPQNHNLDEKQQTILRRKAETCPVAKSLHPDIEIRLEIKHA